MLQDQYDFVVICLGASTKQVIKMNKLVIALVAMFSATHVNADALNDAVNQLKRAGCEIKNNAENIQESAQSRSDWFRDISNEMRDATNLSSCDSYLKSKSAEYQYSFKDFATDFRRLKDQARPICDGSYMPVYSLRNSPDIYQSKVEKFQRLVDDFNYKIEKIKKEEKEANSMITYVKTGC